MAKKICWIVLFGLYFNLFLIHIWITGQKSLPLIFGDREDAIFDLWSFQHLASGIIIGSLLVGFFKKMDLAKLSLIIFAVALSWEALELSMENGCFGTAIAVWKKGYEHWGNRFLGDIPLVIIGGMLSVKYKNLWKVLVIPVILWLIVNIASPNSMYIQQTLINFLKNRS